jgi:hypothetical protein
VAVAHSEAILADNPNAKIVAGDFRRPADLLATPEVTEFLDLSQPIGLLLVALLHFVGDADAPADVIATFRDALAPGSYLVISHATHELHPPELTDFHRDLYRQTATPMTMRSLTQVRELFDGFELVEPGVALSEKWRPEAIAAVDDAERVPIWAGIGRKP